MLCVCVSTYLSILYQNHRPFQQHTFGINHIALSMQGTVEGGQNVVALVPRHQPPSLRLQSGKEKKKIFMMSVLLMVIICLQWLHLVVSMVAHAFSSFFFLFFLVLLHLVKTHVQNTFRSKRILSKHILYMRFQKKMFFFCFFSCRKMEKRI